MCINTRIAVGSRQFFFGNCEVDINFTSNGFVRRALRFPKIVSFLKTNISSICPLGMKHYPWQSYWWVREPHREDNSLHFKKHTVFGSMSRSCRFPQNDNWQFDATTKWKSVLNTDSYQVISAIITSNGTYILFHDTTTCQESREWMFEDDPTPIFVVNLSEQETITASRYIHTILAVWKFQVYQQLFEKIY